MRRFRGVQAHRDEAAATCSEAAARKPLKAVEELDTSIETIRDFIPNDGKRNLHGGWIDAGFLESTLQYEAKALLE